jgi:succinate dehydrogenase / fumarate reductase, membrane anchor subunit
VTVRAANPTGPPRAAWDLPLSPAGDEVEASSQLVDYVLLRVTGLVLSVLVLGHFAVTHLVTDVAQNDSAFVARRLSSALWVAWDATMLAAALAHGTVGVRLALLDYTAGRRAGRLERIVASVAVALFAVGVVAIARAAHV